MSLVIKSAEDYDKREFLEEIALIVAEGFAGKFKKVLFSEEEVLTIALGFCHYILLEKREHLLVAEIDGDIVGCLFFTTAQDKYQRLYRSLKEYLTIWQSMKLVFLLGLLSHQARGEERYIDFVTVSPKYRNQGVGKKLLKYFLNMFKGGP